MSEIIVEMEDYIKIKGGHYKQDLIRCGECENCEIRNNEEGYCHTHAMTVSDDYFCADGVKGEWMP